MVVLGLIQLMANFWAARVQTALIVIRRTGEKNRRKWFVNQKISAFDILGIFVKRFILNWIVPIFITLFLMLALFIAIVINTPAWLFNWGFRNRIDLVNPKAFRRYCAVYAFIAVLLGTTLQLTAALIKGN
jgi:hypothetical protein